jgi:hypothetical protein
VRRHSRKPTTREPLFEDQESEMGKARIAKFYRELDQVIKK